MQSPGETGPGRAAAEPPEITRILKDVESGAEGALDSLARAVYGDLKSMGRRHMRGEARNHTLQPTAVVHEAFLKLVEQRDVSWKGRAHFFAIAGRLMRRILVDAARSRSRREHGLRERTSPLEMQFEADGIVADIEALDEALDRLAEVDRQAAQVVELRFFADQSHAEVAEVLGISERSVRRSFNYAKAWLFRDLERARS